MTSTATRFAMLDLDGTLVDSIGAMRKWAEGLCADYELPAETTDWLIDRRDSYSTWQSFIGAVSEHLGQPEKTQEWCDHLLSNYPHKFVLDPATAERLTSLRAAGWKLAIVTNGSVTLQSAKIGQVRLEDYVDVVCISEAEGVKKPDPVIFERAAGRLGVELGPHGWMVGDTLHADIAGGIAAGLRTVWLPGGREASGPADPQAEHVCGSIVAALDHILASD